MGKIDEIDYNILSQIFEKIKAMDHVQNAMFSKMNELVENSKIEKEKEDKEAHKEKLNEIFKKKSIGKSRGTYEEKQIQYFEMVKTYYIKNPIQKSFDYYDICKNEK